MMASAKWMATGDFISKGSSLAHKHGRYLWIERREQQVGGKENAAANPRPQASKE
jgi:hypothetical protein